MKSLVSAVSTGQALILGLALIGSALAGLITGHLASADFMTVVGVTVGIGGAVTAAHVGGAVANSSAANTTGTTVAPGTTAPTSNNTATTVLPPPAQPVGP